MLQRGLVNYAKYQVCSTTVGIVQDLCRSLRTGILPYCNHILKALYDAAVSQDLNRAVKPVILASFGEVADAIEDQFQRMRRCTRATSLTSTRARSAT